MFKVGDRVVCVEGNTQILVGDGGTIVWMGDELLRIDTSGALFYHRRFVKVSTFKGNK